MLDGAQFPKRLVKIGTKDLKGYPRIKATKGGPVSAKKAAASIMKALNKPFIPGDGLPSNPHLFNYEKDIIDHFVKAGFLMENSKLPESDEGLSREDGKYLKKTWDRYLQGCPIKWPEVVRLEEKDTRYLTERYAMMPQKRGAPLTEEDIKKKKDEWESMVGRFRGREAKVIVAALTDYHKPLGDKTNRKCCLADTSMEMCFPEAGPREFLHFPRRGRKLKVAILVSGGIAPGTNAVIDGIVQRHLQYAREFGYEKSLDIVGIKNGFLAFDNWGDNKSRVDLKAINLNISYRASEGGSLLGTSRVDELLDESDERWDKLDFIVQQLCATQVDILYIIGGDGSMKAAHALWTVAQEYLKTKKPKSRTLSIVAVPKTMDNDILWVWQTFGFLSAVEKDREIIAHLATEV